MSARPARCHDFIITTFSTHTTIAASLALVSAIAFAIATVVQQRAAALVSDEHARSGRIVAQLAHNPRWWAATACNGAGYLLQGAALAFGSLLVVQPILVTSLLFALPLSARLAHRRLPQSVWLWGIVLALSLAVFVVSGNANHGASHATHWHWILVAVVGLPVLAGCLLAAGRTSGTARASLIAIAVGILGAVLAVLTKAVVADLKHGAVPTLVSWETYALLLVGASGIYLQQLAFQAGATSLPPDHPRPRAARRRCARAHIAARTTPRRRPPPRCADPCGPSHRRQRRSRWLAVAPTSRKPLSSHSLPGPPAKSRYGSQRIRRDRDIAGGGTSWRCDRTEFPGA